MASLSGNYGYSLVQGSIKSVTVSFTRPANTTAYDALDAVSNSTTAPGVLKFSDIVNDVGRTGMVVKARLMTSQTTCTAKFRLHLYHTTPTAINDGDPYTALIADFSKKIGYIDFPALATEGTGSTGAGATVTSAVLTSLLPMPIETASNNASIYALLETIDAFTPASGQTFNLQLTVQKLN